MMQNYPIHTEKTECQDCYKCLRHCPIKAIKVERGHATVIPELCVACGHCVEVCPARAKKIRNELPRAKELLSAKPGKVYLSLAPSWPVAFNNIPAARLIAALKSLGFAGISETALGAQLVTSATAEILETSKTGLMLSTACPSALDYVQNFLPQFVKNFTNIHSPLLAHCKMLRSLCGPEIGIVFAGPCIAKKNEADRHPELLDIALSFSELHAWLKESAALENSHPSQDDFFFPAEAEGGRLYPFDGGMLEALRRDPALPHVSLVSLCGLKNIERALAGLNANELKKPVFAELLSCQGGCIHGPCSGAKKDGLAGRIRIIESSNHVEIPRVHGALAGIGEGFAVTPLPRTIHPEDKIIEVLRLVGKSRPEDELNCGGCGYESCRAFATALLEGRAEAAMCVSYMRKQALKKANALLRCIPSGVVIAGADMRIIECNQRFAELFDEGTRCAYEARPGLAGALLNKIVPFGKLFEEVLRNGGELQRDSLHAGQRLFSVTIFSIDPGETVGAVISDVSNTEFRREQIARRAREVINRNLSTVQNIAFKLGEHMADTELLLRSIADDYAAQDCSSRWHDSPRDGREDE